MRAFFFFLGCALVVACRIDWSGSEASAGGCGLAAAIEDVVSLLRGAISDRGCAIASFAVLVVVASTKSSSEIPGEPRRALTCSQTSESNHHRSQNDTIV